MRAYPNEKLHRIAKENYEILFHYCSILESEGYWQQPESVLGRTIYEFLAVYVQVMMVQLAVYMKVEDKETLRMIEEIDSKNPLDVKAERGLTEQNIAQAKRLGMAPPILLQLCSLRDVENRSSITGLFFDALLNILFSLAYLNRRQGVAATSYIKEYYGKIRMFLENADTPGVYVDEKYIFHKICMGELEENTELLKEAGEDFAAYKKQAFFLEEREQKSRRTEAEVGAAAAPQPYNKAESRNSYIEEWDENDSEDSADLEADNEKKAESSFEEWNENDSEDSAADDSLEDNLKEENSSVSASLSNLRLDKLIKRLEELVGLSNVKEEIRSLINLIRVKKMREAYDLPGMPMSYHMVFTGNPGTGKTTVARLVGEIYKELGILSRGLMTETDRTGLVAGYVGQTALKVKEVVDKAKGGVLFIDEAYTLSNSANGNDFGTEAIDTLVKLMEDYRNDLVVIVAGYTAEMENFLKANTGLVSRFNKFIEFSDYTKEELLQILSGMAEKAGFCIEEETKAAVENYLASMNEETRERFGNARGIRNLFEKMVAAQANRVVSYENPTKEQLSAITPQDCSFFTVQNQAGTFGETRQTPDAGSLLDIIRH